MSTSVRVTDAMVHAFDDAYSKNWEAQRHAPEGAQELGTFFATRAGLEAALFAHPSPGGQDALAVIEELAELNRACAALDPDYKGPTDAAVQAAVAALAARQPVGERPVAVSVTPEMRAAFRRAYREGGFWADRLDTALDAMMRAAPPAQAVELPYSLALQVKMREALWAAARSLRTIADSTKETELLESASEIRAYANSRANCAEQALKDSQAVGK